MMTRKKQKAGASKAKRVADGPIDPGTARAALTRAAARLRALPAATVVRPNVDAGAAAHVAVALAGRAAAMRARLEALPSNEFDHASVDRLREGGLALFTAHAAVQVKGAVQSRARLPAALVSEATTVRARMLRLAEYHFEHDPVQGPELVAIRHGQGFLDVAHDLERLADVYDSAPREVHADGKYVAGDEAQARRLAQSILAELDGDSPSSRTARDTEARAFTAARTDYDNVAAAVNWLECNTIGVVPVPTLQQAARPGLGASVRRAMRRKKKASKPPAEGSST